MKVLPMPDYVSAVPYEPPSEGKLLLLEEKFKNYYVVTDIGSKVDHIYTNEIIFVDKYYPIEVQLDGETRFLIHKDKILAVIEW